MLERLLSTVVLLLGGIRLILCTLDSGSQLGGLGSPEG
jgi:hypothetical protein